MKKIRIGTRKSRLALWQAEYVETLLNESGVETEIVTTETIGDKILNTSISKIGSKGVFTEEIEAMLKNGEIDIAVHSAKDMPSKLPEGLELIAFAEREKVNDVLISNNPDFSIDNPPENPEMVLRVGTSSVRRVAMMKHYYPAVKTVDMRGNLQTRIRKMEEGQCDALMLAYAGVRRMDYEGMIVKTFSEKEFTTPTGQGSVAVEIASSAPKEIRETVRNCINCPETEIRLLAERAFLEELQGGCSIPVFAYAEIEGGRLSLSAGLISLDGKNLIRHTMEGDKSASLKLGKDLGRLVLENGGKEILETIRAAQ